jgi:hypothetical protein
LFVEITKSGNFDEFMEYTIVTDWTKLPDEDNVYYKVVETNDADQPFHVLAGDKVHVKESVRKTQLNALGPGENGTWEAEELAKLPSLSFKAYAVQHKNVETVSKAWEIAKAERDVPTATPESSDAPADSQ